MIRGKVHGWALRTGQDVFGHNCPECGAKMTEAERVSENGFLFIWYECSRAGCGGQWLEKRLFGATGSVMDTMRPAHVFEATVESGSQP
jgi:predicted RNA-binding Zn-ribbon protein involved in translation (DUF1610 family)